MSLHDRFDLSYWVQQFPLSKLRAEARDFVLRRRQELPQEYPDDSAVESHIDLMRPDGDFVVGPESVAVIEQLRAEALTDNQYSGERVPTDVFVWARGEPANRAVTKTGGLPYRSADSPWPRSPRGEPLGFIAQICFADSGDLVGELPGDVLLVFGDDEALVCEPQQLVFEWSKPGILNPTAEVPVSAAEPFTPYYGVIHRTEDWPDAVEELFQNYRRPEQIAIFEGTKIGGVPSPIQADVLPSGRFLAALGSISVDRKAPHPFVNVSGPLGRWGDDNDLMIGDMGSLYLFIDKRGRVCASSQCY
jgi:hypothetical protein